MNENVKTGLWLSPLATTDPQFGELMKWFWSFVSGLLMSVLGYFLPVHDIIHLLILFFIVDVILGYYAAKKLRKEKFSAKIIWNTTMPRMVISLVLIMGAYMWDTVYQQEFVSTYKIIGWFISGVLLASIVQNGYRITNWNMLSFLGDFLRDKIKDSTGIDINNKNEENENGTST